MADKKVSELSAITNLSGDDLLLVVNDPSGTPTSNKITVRNVFANVAVTSTFKANTVFSGSRMTITANVIIDGTNIVTRVNDRMQVANVTSTYVTNTAFQSALTSTNSAISDRLQVSNAISTFATVSSVTSTYVTNTAFQSALANTNSAVSDRLQVSNAFATFANSADPIFTGTGTADSLNTNFMTIINPKGLLMVGGGLTTQVPATSNTTTEGLNTGTIWYSNNYLYIAVDNNTIKRIELESF